MAVRTDDGRSVAFDTKDYAHIDHGYAATIHKAQGMTVDRTHVLATPGMDSHGSYVALSRHRDGMDLHYGRDDFADQENSSAPCQPRARQGHGDAITFRETRSSPVSAQQKLSPPSGAASRFRAAQNSVAIWPATLPLPSRWSGAGQSAWACRRSVMDTR
jgi:hypothetical protein